MKMEGILPLWKPKGMTSHDCVMRIRKILKTKKVGHTGTLDPDVDGVLPICIGRATKIAEYITNSPKAYEAEVTIGIATTTEDASGEIVRKKPIQQPISKADIKKVLQLFQGQITQVVPMYSAVKINGKRLYEYARQGIEIERPSREVYIYALELLNSFAEINQHTTSFQFYVKASKGTYVRTLAVDIGKALGYPAHMSKLTRVESGSFTKKDCFTFQEVEEQWNNDCLRLFPLERALDSLPKLKADKKLETKVKNGQVLPIPEGKDKSNRLAIFNQNEECIAIYILHPSKKGVMKPEKVLRNE